VVHRARRCRRSRGGRSIDPPRTQAAGDCGSSLCPWGGDWSLGPAMAGPASAADGDSTVAARRSSVSSVPRCLRVEARSV